MKLWGGRFRGKLDPGMWALNASILFDQRLGTQDVRGSIAWARALQQVGVLTLAEAEQICAGLNQVGVELEQGSFVFVESDEDIHTAVERRLGELVGESAGKLHTGRSRNDQVATDLRLWLLDHLPVMDEAIRGLQGALLQRAQDDLDILIPGYTHLQRAQPLLLSHWWLSHFWPLQRDRQRLAALRDRVAIMPLGCGALAGAPFNIDRQYLAAQLGFDAPAPNSIDAVADRDFVVEFLFFAALTGVHLSRLAEAVILYTSAEFGFFELDDAFATGSSLMPQKKNPDAFELARGKSGSLIGRLAGLLATLKGLPSAYDKDLQEDKEPLFAAFDTLRALLPVISGAIRSLKLRPQRMLQALDASMLATDLADYLVEKGTPFRQAHNLAGQAVQSAAEQGLSLAELEIEQYQAISPNFSADVRNIFDPQRSIARRVALGGTARPAVEAQLASAQRIHVESILQKDNQNK